MPYVGKKATNVVDVSETQSLTVDGDLTLTHIAGTTADADLRLVQCLRS
jgi:hypothetical protein